METSAILGRVEAMRLRAQDRDSRNRDVLAIRRGDYEQVAPGMFPEEYDKPLVANMVDTIAHDLAEVMAPLPAINCASSSQTSDSARKFAEKRSLIANYYAQASRLKKQRYMGADRYNSFGYFAYLVEPDPEDFLPYISVDKALNAYWACDHRDRVVQYASVHLVPSDEVCFLYPEAAEAVRAKHGHRQLELEVIVWRDKTHKKIILADPGIELDSMENPTSRCPVFLVERPSVDNENRGQFDDVIWVQVARAMTAHYRMEALEQSVHAPMVVPNDVQELTIGPNEVLQTETPQGVGRVNLNINPALFTESQILAQEQRTGSRYPEGRSGSIDASIVTGQGVQALMGTFDTQVQTFQNLDTEALADAVSCAFEMDEALWPSKERSVRVRDNGSPVEITYKPNKDIKNDYSVDVTYGAVAGLDPNRAIVFLLQAMSGGLLARSTVRNYLPMEIDPVAEEKRINEEALRESMFASVAALPQAIPMLASQGQDPRQIVEQVARVKELLDKGKPIEAALKEVFAPKQEEQPAGAPAPDPLAALMGGEGGAAPPGAAPQAPGTPGQELLSLVAGLSGGGDPRLSANVVSQQPA